MLEGANELEQYLHNTKRFLDGCWEWKGCFNTDGYARAGNKHTSNIKVHREVFRLTYGYYPEVVRHTCDNKKCINPHHLVGGSPEDNVRDRVDRGRTHNHVTSQEFSAVVELRGMGLTMRDIAFVRDIKIKRVEYILTVYNKGE